ncbi:MAG: hypothetical protein ACYSTS_04220 [Planctomycetota bacterium]|jgi:hypothetical protein
MDRLCPRPEVIVDFIFEDGLLYVSIKNIGAKPAYKISTHFDKPFAGVEGTKNFSELPLFRCIEFLPPQKEIKTFLDKSISYFGRNEPTIISAVVQYESSFKKKYSQTMTHNLEIYKELGYIHGTVFHNILNKK